tara:strand:- start:224 stop:2212 length:1989 start_codon:yes stop_codon:yes gene_type:complete
MINFIKRAAFENTIENFKVITNEEILGYLSSSSNYSDELNQKKAWYTQINILKDSFYKKVEGFILFEFQIPRINKRIDNILIIGDKILVIEFKVGSKKFESKDKDQLMDYALCLKNFHETSFKQKIIPILVSTEAKSIDFKLNYFEDDISELICANKNNLSEIISFVGDQIENNSIKIDLQSWLNGVYKPTPTIIEASKALYRNHNIAELTHNEAGSNNLYQTTQLLNKTIDNAKKYQEKRIVFISGVPGSGKTLIGLNIACERRCLHNEDLNAVYLSGNLPLVNVLTESLIKDAKDRDNLDRNKSKLQIISFLQTINKFVIDNLSTLKAPSERIIIFDEAQRAWNKERFSQELQKNNSKGDAGFKAFLDEKSQPQFLIDVMNRHEGWAVIICLIGGGQEINRGEAGLEEWLLTLEKFPNWKVSMSNHLGDQHFISSFNFDSLKERLYLDDLLYLKFSNRSFRSEKLSFVISKILEGEIKNINDYLNEIKNYQIKITRSLEKAKKYLREKARGSERIGLLASSQAKRLKAIGINPNLITPKEIHHWFLRDKNDIRSSNYLEDAISEFKVQGLEIDWAGVIWGGDFIRGEDKWIYQKLAGSKWCLEDKSKHKYKLNAYRVLLTRARQGMVIVVPKGDLQDPTRSTNLFDPTWNYLRNIGFDVL